MTGGPERNRRGARRYLLHVDARVGDCQARIRDMSSRGVYLVLPRECRVGCSLEIDLDLPQGGPSGPLPLHLRVRVVRVEKLARGTGVGSEIESWEAV